MERAVVKSVVQAGIGFVVAAVAGSILFAQTPATKAPRGEPIKPLAPKGNPIQPLVPGAGPTNIASSASEAPVKNGMQEVGFDKLAGFNYVVPEYTGTIPPPMPDTNQIPATIKAYDGRKVAIKGFMLPLKVKEGKVTELLLMRDQSMCCFGAVPKINEFLTVKMVGEGTKAVMDQAVTLVGTLKVGEFSENGYLLGIYQMDGERAEGPGL